MFEWVLSHETWFRLSATLLVFVIMALWEGMAPRRERQFPRLLRWPSNLGIVVLNAVCLRILFPTLAVGLALLAEVEGWGLFNVIALPAPVAFLTSLLLLDMAIYLQHVMFHAVPALWRLHRMHHADLDFDVSTGLRFHPIEIVLSMLLKLGLVAALGPSALAVIVFEVVLNGAAMFNHANAAIPPNVDRWLRWFIVTPDMHRVHHSIYPEETNSNFGFNLPWWDRLFGTYCAQPRDGHAAMLVGINLFRKNRELWLDRMLTQPFRGSTQDYPINRSGAAEPPSS